MENKVIKAVCFDLDGVLVDMCEGHKIALNKALREVSNTNIPNDRHYAEFNGLPTKVKLEKLAREGAIDYSDIQEIFDKKQRYTLECIENTIQPNISTIHLLESLRDEYQYSLVCVTNSIRRTASSMLKSAEIYQYFDFIISNEDAPKPKPAPDGYLLAVNRLRLDKNQVIAVEDSPHGITAAKNAGLHVWEVRNPSVVTLENFESYLETLP